MNDTVHNSSTRCGRRGFRARVGVGLLALGLASGVGLLAMGAQPASAATVVAGSTSIVKLSLPAPFTGGVQSFGVSWS